MSDDEKAVKFDLRMTEASSHYLEASARLRRVSRSELVRRTIQVIVEEQMFTAILDDGGHSKRKPGDRGPADKLFTCLKEHA